MAPVKQAGQRVAQRLFTQLRLQGADFIELPAQLHVRRVLGDGPLIPIARKCEEVQPQRRHAQRRGAQIGLGVPGQRHRQRDQRDPDPYIQ